MESLLRSSGAEDELAQPPCLPIRHPVPPGGSRCPHACLDHKCPCLCFIAHVNAVPPTPSGVPRTSPQGAGRDANGASHLYSEGISRLPASDPTHSPTPHLFCWNSNDTQ